MSFITVTLGFLIALLLPCSKIIEPEAVEGINERLVQFTCPSGYYNEMASLMVNAYDNSIALLYNSETAFTIPVLIPGAIIIFFCANMAAGLGISGGMVQVTRPIEFRSGNDICSSLCFLLVVYGVV